MKIVAPLLWVVVVTKVLGRQVLSGDLLITANLRTLNTMSWLVYQLVLSTQSPYLSILKVKRFKLQSIWTTDGKLQQWNNPLESGQVVLPPVFSTKVFLITHQLLKLLKRFSPTLPKVFRENLLSLPWILKLVFTLSLIILSQLINGLFLSKLHPPFPFSSHHNRLTIPTSWMVVLSGIPTWSQVSRNAGNWALMINTLLLTY